MERLKALSYTHATTHTNVQRIQPTVIHVILRKANLWPGKTVLQPDIALYNNS